MIDREYCVTMARYSQWQNREMLKTLETLPVEELTKERGAFFGSIMGTINHLLWADQMWMSRFDRSKGPGGGIPESRDLTPTLAVWGAERFQTDGRILLWAEQVKSLDLVGDLKWFSGALGQSISRPAAVCIIHMFNHQTHHRGQVHAMMTQAGLSPAATDIPFMPEED
ncbi:MAG: DinB family protein [Pseudomonadota bacterium]